MALIDTMVDDSRTSSKRWEGWHIIGFLPEGLGEVVCKDGKGLLTEKRIRLTTHKLGVRGKFTRADLYTDR